MKNKACDEYYCGVDCKKIARAHVELNWKNVEHFRKFVIDRYTVHVKKDALKWDAPWTDNPIIQEFKFTNVRREHDRQSKYLINNIIKNANMTLEDKIVNCFMFRCWNNWDTLESFGFPYSARRIYSPKLKEYVRPTYDRLNLETTDRKWWSNAYNQGGTKAAWKFPDGDGYQRAYKESEACKHADWEKEIALRPFHVGVWLGRNKIVEKLLAASNQQEAFEVIKSVRGFADFLAYQVFVDLTYIKEFPFSENEFVVAGPGCKRGLDLIFKDADGMSYSEQMFWLRNEINADFSLFKHKMLSEDIEWDPDEVFCDLKPYDRCMNVMSIENCMCELSKYVKAADGTGRPRNKYKGGTK